MRSRASDRKRPAPKGVDCAYRCACAGRRGAKRRTIESDSTLVSISLFIEVNNFFILFPSRLRQTTSTSFLSKGVTVCLLLCFDFTSISLLFWSGRECWVCL